jgi:hypothetical protein
MWRKAALTLKNSAFMVNEFRLPVYGTSRRGLF